MNSASDICPVCGGQKTAGTATFSADLGSGVVVVRNVAATVCSQCGEEWIDDQTARKLEAIADEARKQRSLVQVTAAS